MPSAQVVLPFRRGNRSERGCAFSAGSHEIEGALSHPDEDADPADTVSGLIRRAAGGDRSALDEAVARLYEELRSAAEARRAQWRGNETVSATVLVNEVYLRLASQTDPEWASRAQFLAVASRAMRQVLIDYSRHHKARKRGGGLRRVTLDQADEVLVPGATSAAAQAEALVRLDECLHRLERESDRHARIVECRFFGGMTIEETGEALGLSTATVNRGWQAARAWLRREVTESLDGLPGDGT
jgi:RNA polymerase sigma factor (TIGR02999 family)